MPIDPKLAQMLLETFKTELQELHQSMINDLLSLEKAHSAEEVEEILKRLFRYSHNMKGAAACSSVDAIASMAHRLEDLFSKWRETHHIPDISQINACLEVADNTLLALEDHCNAKAIDIENYLKPLSGKKTIHSHTDTGESELIKLPLARLERVSAKANEFITYRLKLMNWFKSIDYHLSKLNETDLDLAPLLKKLGTISRDSGQFLGEFSRAVQSLQDDLRAMRMLPISNLLVPLNRTVRDVAASLNKTVELRVQGGDIELDKTIIDAIREPLVHLIRNAIDHGIESDEKRKELNKPYPAILSIQVTQSAGKIKLSCCDDGQGINLDKIRKHAVESGFYSQNEVNSLDEEQLLDCLFLSGFSLQKQITELSGRGVGLDVVKSAIEKIKGTIQVKTTPGHGTCFIFNLPLTLATTRGVFFKSNEQTFMLPTLSLDALYEIEPDKLQQVDNKSVLIVNNRPIPIKVLQDLLYAEKAVIDRNSIYYGLLLNFNNKPLILLVDAILDEQDCVVKPLPYPLSKLEQFIGVTLTGESELVLVLDPIKLMQRAQADEQSWFKHAPQSKELREVSKKRVLIVDDSLTTRSLCTNALEAAGYETVSADNGQKAWQLLQNKSFDAVITDIVMPKMDGFKLTELIKKSEKLFHTPVIIVSLLHSEEDKRRGLDAGANAFLVKSEFDTHSLIDVMESLL
ncbi:response regulator [Legionella sp. 16cNR16C]|uniref:hybrid sensor histidine kinase/response regulator n=1 Tax=Legionella sp. 16cNR16C TaxID=2905656 RepID=UPI001E36978D|nr:response regulator [Legionella sp. 16cNR16C]MCE3046420.1 response regulator [Legionella sp. 16cNR16C]